MEFPRPGKKETTKVYKDKFKYEIREEGKATHYLEFNRVNCQELFGLKTIAPCRDDSYAD